MELPVRSATSPEPAIPVGTETAEHLLCFPGGAWSLWRWVALRGAGLPAAQVLTLAVPDCAAAADRVLELEEDAEWARRRAVSAIRGDLKRSEGDLRTALRRARRRLEAGEPPDEPVAWNAATGADMEAFRVARAAVDAAQAELAAAFETAIPELTAACRRAAAEPLFQEALLWQNRRAFHTGILPLLQAPSALPGRPHRRREELVARYLQRYCVKNDTIGFFGPVGWAAWTEGGEVMTVRPGPDLVRRRVVFFEGWPIDILADLAVAQGGLRPWLPPRRPPFAHVEDGVARLPFEEPRELTPAQAVVFAACDGRRPARDIAAELPRHPGSPLLDAEHVYAVLEELVQARLLVWKVEIPLQQNPDRLLRPMLEAAEDPAVREPALATLDGLVAARDAVARAAGDPQALDRALGDLEETFTERTGAAATREAGRTYAARTLVYEDCVRDVEVELGPHLLSALERPLDLLLLSARWLSFRVGEAYLRAFDEIYDQLAARAGSPVVEFSEFYFQGHRLLFGFQERPMDPVLSVFQQIWAELLHLKPGARRIQASCEKLRPGVQALFQAPGPGWAGARYHSPDLMISAPSVEAVRRGQFQLVLGEFHVGTNTLGSSVFVEHHPRPEELFRAVEADIRVPRVIPVTPKDFPRATTRMNLALYASYDYLLPTSSDVSGISNAQVLPVADLVIERRGRLVVRSRDGRLQLDPMDFFAATASTLLSLDTKFLPPATHMPRIQLDRLVMVRESWRFPAAELTFAQEKDDVRRFLGARRWKRENGMPRWVFVKATGEVKPFFLDFDSPLYVDILAKEVRRSAESGLPDPSISVTEMLPEPDQTWLPDAQGRTYTSELRMVVLDPALPVGGSAAVDSRTERNPS